jgi:hypothetical protein
MVVSVVEEVEVAGVATVQQALLLGRHVAGIAQLLLKCFRPNAATR